MLVRLYLAIAATAGAVVYRMAMNTSAQPAERRASLTFGTVKNRMITCGRPAVPIINERVYMNMFSFPSATLVVYLLNPSSVTTWSSLTNSGVPSATSPPRPSWGIGLPVICREMKMAGTV